jgi:GTP-binding protein HflX
VFNLTENAEQRKGHALLLSTYQHQQERNHCLEMLEELEELTNTCGPTVLDQLAVRIRARSPRLLLGSGKAQEVVVRLKELKADLLIFDDTLTPAQQRNWEKLSGVQVMDRHEVILTIFGNRATTKEAELQIALAQAEYMLPRLKNLWTHFGRQRAVVGLRGGEGEKQIEIDSRLLRRRIAHLQKELVKVSRQREQQRKRRREVPVPNAAIVGYTNAGKSSLLKKLTQADVLIEDKLFATLDPTTRRIQLPNNQILLLTDTVGFIRNLPHDLVEAFKATLEEAVLADFLVHIVDVNSTAFLDHMATTDQVLEEIGAGGKESLVVFNKIDMAEPFLLRRLRRDYPDAIFMSALTGEGTDILISRINAIIDLRLSAIDLKLPMDRFDVLASLHRNGNVESEDYDDDSILVRVTIPHKYVSGLEKYVVV